MLKVEVERYREIMEEKFGELLSSPEEVVSIMMTTFVNYLHCTKCDEVKPKKMFYPNKAYKARGGYSTICCECGPKYQKEKRTKRKGASNE